MTARCRCRKSLYAVRITLLSFCILLLIYFAITIHAARHAAFFFFFRRPRYFMLDFRH